MSTGKNVTLVRHPCCSFLFTMVCVASTFLLGTLFFHFDEASTSVSDITYFWQTEPIVSIYVPYGFQEGICGTGYEPVSFDYIAIQSLLPGPCGCAQNRMSYNSTSSECLVDCEESDACMSLSPMPGVTTTSWRQSTICVKRGGSPAATYKDQNYWSRPHPDKNGQCPTEYKRCGQGYNQESGAICFPVSSPCPVTNMIVLPSSDPVLADQGWESVGVFEAYNTTLYVRREHLNELPIIDVVARLTELTPQGQNVRGQCYQGAPQTFDQSLVSDPDSLWSYTTMVPNVCEGFDSRYELFDSVDLQGHFLENLQLTQPSCEPFALYPTYDPRYNDITDPDYLNSGVKCDFTSKYTCVRDPYQRSDCAAGDAICDGVVNQNICGEYAHAVRSAFTNITNPAMNNHTNPVTLGLYYAREIQWSDSCAVSKEDIFAYPDVLPYVFVALLLAWLIWLLPFLFCCNRNPALYSKDVRSFCILVPVMACGETTWLLVVAMQKAYKWREVYAAVDNGTCTDFITTDILLDRLDYLHRWDLMVATMVLTGCYFVYVFTDKVWLPSAPPEETHQSDNHDNDGTFAIPGPVQSNLMGLNQRDVETAYSEMPTIPSGMQSNPSPLEVSLVPSSAIRSAAPYQPPVLPSPAVLPRSVVPLVAQQISGVPTEAYSINKYL